MFITRVKRRVVLLQSFEHFMASFLWSIRVQTMENCGRFVFTITFIFSTKRRCSCCFSYFCSTFAASSTNSLSEISPHMLTFGSSLSMLRSKIICTKNQKTKQPLLPDMLRHFHGLYSHRPQLSTNQRARIRSVKCKINYTSS